jgi:undecaprenyl diphosphate synthase
MEGYLEVGSEAHGIFLELDPERLPRHVAVIMDGNGRWATMRHRPRVSGHQAGIDSVREVVELAARLRLGVLTLYAFSLENWKRPKAEVTTLMLLLRRYLRRELKTLLGNDIRFRPVGRIDDLPEEVQAELSRAVDATAGNGGLLFQVALNYGGRAEIVDACRRVVRSGLAEAEIDEAAIARNLYTAGAPDPDLLIRTSGELRVSNFLLWQIAYAEIWVTPTLWPDFRRQHFLQALLDYQRRDRRYGAVTSR